MPKIVKKTKKPWISTDILDMMEKRKRAKHTQYYDEINRQVKRACKIAKENWLEEQCQEIEKEALVNVWTEYIGELYADDRVTRPEINYESGPSITSTEVKHAIKMLT